MVPTLVLASTLKQKAAVFSSATTTSTQIEVLEKGTSIQVTGDEIGGDSTYWFPVTTSSGKKGYVRSSMVQLDSEPEEYKAPFDPSLLPDTRFLIATSPFGDFSGRKNLWFSVGILPQLAVGFKYTVITASSLKLYSGGSAYEFGPRISFYSFGKRFGSGFVVHGSLLKQKERYYIWFLDDMGDAFDSALPLPTVERSEIDGWGPEVLVGYAFRLPVGLYLEGLLGFNRIEIIYRRYNTGTSNFTEYQPRRDLNNGLIELNVGYSF